MPSDPGTDDVPRQFTDIYPDECAAVRRRRERVGIQTDATKPLTDLRGLALSGGGIRSATFCLGVLQQLAADKRLRCFDYLSTVSGGGFIGGWWTAWLSRPEQRETDCDRAGTLAVFPDPEGLELDREQRPEVYTPDGSRFAGVDPIHHVRLFSNYLTPRKGVLSSDTWRAVTVVTRNFFLTVLTLLPILGAAVFLAQLYFVADDKLAAAFVCGQPPEGATAGASALPPVCGTFTQSLGAHPWDLTVRAARALVPVVVLLVLLAVVTGFWALASMADMRLAGLAFLGVVAMLFFALRGLALSDHTGIGAELLTDRWFVAFTTVGTAVMAAWAGYMTLVRLRQKDGSGSGRVLSAEQGEVLTERLTRVQTWLAVTLAVIGVVLLFGGFGHELVRVAFAGGRGGLAAYLGKVGGWGGVMLAAAGAAFTAVKAAPAGGGSKAPAGEPGRLASLAFAVTPPLVILVLMLVLATASHALLGALPGPEPGRVSGLHVGLFLAVGICALFACYEYIAAWGPKRGRVLALTAAALLGVVAAVLPLPHRRWVATGAFGLGLGLVAIPWLVFVLLPWLRRSIEERARRTFSAQVWRRWTAAALVGTPVILAVVAALLDLFSIALGSGSEPVARGALGGMTFAAVLLALLPLGSTHNLRAMSLLTLGFVLLGIIYIEQFLDPRQPQVYFPQAIVGFIGVALASVIGLGWLVDPNYLSLHSFYRARLVRAYLGASNEARLDSEITEAVDGDDLQLASVGAGLRPAPYHLVNTTLNLVAGRDLATAQRSSAAFTFSPLSCGSLRTGYRPTARYMGGRLTLGTALAVSGAAVSPNMGSKTTSAALAMLLALLNVRLGFWAPNPAKERWRARRARLWPFYILREFLSQTNDLSAYCYLSDGGHFDNTGLYSLVQRGCRSILLVDCGADPRPCFADIGDAIRRCRIDFSAEVRLSVNQFVRPPGQPLSAVHYVVGEVLYHQEHAVRLGWGDLPNPDDRRGVIVWIKPSLMVDDPAEVRQYALENSVFPQQSTGDQWFDEAQFESYRRLGAECARAATSDPAVAAAFPAVAPSA